MVANQATFLKVGCDGWLTADRDVTNVRRCAEIRQSDMVRHGRLVEVARKLRVRG